MANLSAQTLAFLQSNYYVHFENRESDFEENVEMKDATSIYILADKEGETFYGKSIKLPKVKEATIEYIQSKLIEDKIFTNFAEKFAKLVNDRSFAIYPTSYGIGVSILFTSDKSADCKKVTEKLDSLGIKYTNEYSEAAWVFRYKISKSKENMSIIEKL